MENNTILLLLIAVVGIGALSGLFYITTNTGAASYDYVTCCCDILTGNEAPYQLVRTQIQTFEPNCPIACSRYAGADHNVFAEVGYCS